MTKCATLRATVPSVDALRPTITWSDHPDMAGQTSGKHLLSGPEKTTEQVLLGDDGFCTNNIY